MRILLGAEMKNGSDTDSNVKIYKNAEYTFAKDVQDADVKFPVTAEGQSDKTESGVNAFLWKPINPPNSVGSTWPMVSAVSKIPSLKPL